MGEGLRSVQEKQGGLASLSPEELRDTVASIMTLPNDHFWSLLLV